MKKLAAFLTITAFLSPFSFAEPTAVNVPVETPAIAPVSINNTMQIEAITKHEKDDELPYTIDYTYPQITGESLSASAEEFNRLMIDMVNKSVQQFKNYVKADMPHMQTLPDSVKHNTFNMNYKVNVIKPAKKTIISVRFKLGLPSTA